MNLNFSRNNIGIYRGSLLFLFPSLYRGRGGGVFPNFFVGVYAARFLKPSTPIQFRLHK